MFLAAGAHYVVPDFAWVQDVGGNLMVLADQVCRAVTWVYKNAARFELKRPLGERVKVILLAACSIDLSMSGGSRSRSSKCD
jgi:hypothetical protein